MRMILVAPAMLALALTLAACGRSNTTPGEGGSSGVVSVPDQGLGGANDGAPGGTDAAMGGAAGGGTEGSSEQNVGANAPMAGGTSAQ